MDDSTYLAPGSFDACSRVGVRVTLHTGSPCQTGGNVRSVHRTASYAVLDAASVPAVPHPASQQSARWDGAVSWTCSTRSLPQHPLTTSHRTPVNHTERRRHAGRSGHTPGAKRTPDT